VVIKGKWLKITSCTINLNLSKLNKMGDVSFRQKALKKISSPEDISQSLKVVRPRHIAVFIGLSLMLVFFLLWGFRGSLPIFVDGSGILIQEKGLRQVKIPFGGTIDTLAVNLGDTIHKGQLLATAEQIDLQFEVRKLEADYRMYEKRLNRFGKLVDPQLKRQREANLKASISSIKDSLKLIKTQIGKASTNFDRTRLASYQSSLDYRYQKLNLAYVEAKNFELNDFLEAKKEMEALQNTLNQKRSELRFKSQIESPYNGMIVEVSLDDGDIFDPATNLMTVENYDDQQGLLEAKFFVDAKLTKKLQSGMKVYISTSTFSKEEYGYIIGEVDKVSKYPATREGLYRILRNDELVEELSSSNLPAYFSVNLLQDSTNFSGLKWSAGTGPNAKILAGSLAEARVLIDEKAPINLLFPFINAE